MSPSFTALLYPPAVQGEREWWLWSVLHMLFDLFLWRGHFSPLLQQGVTLTKDSSALISPMWVHFMSYKSPQTTVMWIILPWVAVTEFPELIRWKRSLLSSSPIYDLTILQGQDALMWVSHRVTSPTRKRASAWAPLSMDLQVPTRSLF